MREKTTLERTLEAGLYGMNMPFKTIYYTDDILEKARMGDKIYPKQECTTSEDILKSLLDVTSSRPHEYTYFQSLGADKANYLMVRHSQIKEGFGVEYFITTLYPNNSKRNTSKMIRDKEYKAEWVNVYYDEDYVYDNDKVSMPQDANFFLNGPLFSFELKREGRKATFEKMEGEFEKHTKGMGDIFEETKKGVVHPSSIYRIVLDFLRYKV